MKDKPLKITYRGFSITAKVSDGNFIDADYEFIDDNLKEKYGVIVGGGLRAVTLTKERDLDTLRPYSAAELSFNMDLTRYNYTAIKIGDIVRVLNDKYDKKWLVESVSKTAVGVRTVNLMNMAEESEEVETVTVFGRMIINVTHNHEVNDRLDMIIRGKQLYNTAERQYYTVSRALGNGCVIDPRVPEQVLKNIDHNREHFLPNSVLENSFISIGSLSREAHRGMLQEKAEKALSQKKAVYESTARTFTSNPRKRRRQKNFRDGTEHVMLSTNTFL